jgi:hypothetical protein
MFSGTELTPTERFLQHLHIEAPGVAAHRAPRLDSDKASHYQRVVASQSLAGGHSQWSEPGGQLQPVSQ